MAEITTDVVLTAKTKGLDKATREVLGLNKSAYEGLKKQAAATKDVVKEIQNYEKQLIPVAKRQAELAKAMLNVKKGSAAYKELRKALSDVSDEYKDIERAMSAVARANDKELKARKAIANAEQEARRQRQQEQRAAKGAFSQGLFQGAGIPSDYLLRGPGMRQQVAGQMVGSGIRRAGQFGWGMTGGALLGGLQGLQAGVSAIPVVGGAIAGQLGAAAGFAGQALDYERQQVESAPFARLGRGSMAARQRLGEFERRTESVGVPASKLPPGLGYTPDGRIIGPQRGQAIDPTSRYGKYLTQKRQEVTSDDIVQVPFSSRLPGEAEGERRARVAQRDQELNRLRSEAAREAASSPQIRLRQMGERFGFTQQEALQQVATMGRRGGTVFTGERGQMRDLETAMAAQRQFGISADISGTLLRGATKGGLVGGGSGANALTSALRGAITLGLNDSEVGPYLEQIASGIMQFQQTGIPFNQAAITSISKVFAEGLTPMRAAKVGKDLGQYFQGIGQRGITGGFDLMALQTLGGYRGGQGKGPSLEESLIALEELGGKLGKEGAGAEIGPKVKKLLKDAMELSGGDPMQQRLFLGRLLGKTGSKMSTREMSILGKRIQGLDLSKEEQQLIKKGPTDTTRVSSPEALIASATQQIRESGSNLKAQAALLNTQLKVGKSMLPIVNKLNASATKTNAAFMNLSENTLKRVSSSLNDLATKVESITRGENGFLDMVKAGVNTVSGMN